MFFSEQQETIRFLNVFDLYEFGCPAEDRQSDYCESLSPRKGLKGQEFILGSSLRKTGTVDFHGWCTPKGE